MNILLKPTSFEWDKGNTGKNNKHSVQDQEAEEIFFDERKVIAKDVLHSGTEKRYILLGKTKKGRLLYTVFTIRKEKLRIISSRDVNKREEHLYEKSIARTKV